MRPRTSPVANSIAALTISCAVGQADPIFKENNTDNLNLTTAWAGGVPPGTSDIATWNASVLAANPVLLGADVSYAGLKVESPGGLVSIGAGNILTLGASGIDLGSATQNLSIASGLSIGVNQTWNVGTGVTLTTSGASSGAGTITKSGAGGWSLASVLGTSGGAVLSGGTTTVSTASFANVFNGGALEFRNGAVLSSAIAGGGTISLLSNVLIAAGQSGTINLNGTNRAEFGTTTAQSLTGSGTITFNLNGNNSTRADVRWATDTFAGNFVVDGNAGTGRGMRLRDNGGDWNGFTAASLTISGSANIETTLFSGGGNYGIGALSGNSANAVLNGSNMAGILNWSIGGRNENTSYAGQINGNAAIFKVGTGIQIFSGALAYSGVTNVNGGTLLFNGTKTGASAVNVNADGTLGGTGSFAGALTVGANGTLAPGASIESLKGGAVTFNNTSTYAFEIDSSAAPAASADLYAAAGGLALNGLVTLTLTDVASLDTAFAAGTVISLVNYTGAWNLGLFTYGGNELADGESFSDGLNEWAIDYDATAGGLNFAADQAAGSFVNLTAVPEVSTILISGLGMLGMLRRRR